MNFNNFFFFKKKGLNYLNYFNKKKKIELFKIFISEN